MKKEKERVNKLAMFNFLTKYTTKSLAFLIDMKLVIMRAKTYHGCGWYRCDQETTLLGIATWVKKTTEAVKNAKFLHYPEDVVGYGNADGKDGLPLPQ